jgi:hypothetical protein
MGLGCGPAGVVTSLPGWHAGEDGASLPTLQAVLSPLAFPCPDPKGALKGTWGLQNEHR